MKNVRVRVENVDRLVTAFSALGKEVKVVEAKTRYCGGCSDPECCSQHDAYYRPEGWRSLLVDCTRKEIEQAFELAGLR